MMPRLGVNIDHIATLRQQRLGSEPCLTAAAEKVLKSGADGITVHLREDRRHIQDKDVFELRKIKGMYLNLEMSASEDILKIALKVKPDSVCLVPEKRRELTTEGGLNAVSGGQRLKRFIKRLKKKSILVSIFADPDVEQIKACRDLGADAVELHTGKYADAANSQIRARELKKIIFASRIALHAGIRLHAGHGLNYVNVGPVAAIRGMKELNIGFSIVARSVFAGLEKAVKEMKTAIRKA